MESPGSKEKTPRVFGLFRGGFRGFSASPLEYFTAPIYNKKDL